MATKKVTKGFSPFRRFAMDKSAETEGVWFDYEEGSRLLVARYGNLRHVAAERELERKNEIELDSDDITKVAELRMAMNVELFAKTVLKGWEGIVDENGKDFPYTYENAKTLLELPEFFGAVVDFASEIDRFRKFKEADAVKN